MGFSKQEQETLVSALDPHGKGAVTFVDLTEFIGAADDGTAHDPMLKASEAELDGYRRRANVRMPQHHNSPLLLRTHVTLMAPWPDSEN